MTNNQDKKNDIKEIKEDKTYKDSMEYYNYYKVGGPGGHKHNNFEQMYQNKMNEMRYYESQSPYDNKIYERSPYDTSNERSINEKSPYDTSNEKLVNEKSMYERSMYERSPYDNKMYESKFNERSPYDNINYDANFQYTYNHYEKVPYENNHYEHPHAYDGIYYDNKSQKSYSHYDTGNYTTYPKIHRESRRKAKQRVCSNCATTSTPSWRRGENGKSLLCNACGLYQKLHGRARPFTVTSNGRTKALKGGYENTMCVNCNALYTISDVKNVSNPHVCDNCLAQIKNTNGEDMRDYQYYRYGIILIIITIRIKRLRLQ